jgi:hypothetical protein
MTASLTGDETGCGAKAALKIGERGAESGGLSAGCRGEHHDGQGQTSSTSSPARSCKIVAILTYLIMLVTMVYGPIAAMLVELFPTRIRYSGLSLPYHIGNGWFGGLLPATAFAISAQSGNIYAGLWYAIVVALMTVVIGAIFVPGGTHKKSSRTIRTTSDPSLDSIHAPAGHRTAGVSFLLIKLGGPQVHPVAPLFIHRTVRSMSDPLATCCLHVQASWSSRTRTTSPSRWTGC